MSDIQYIIDPNEPFRGSCQSTTKDGLVLYSGYLYGKELGITDRNLTFDEYKAATGNFALKMLSEAEFWAMVEDWQNSLKTAPQEITEEEYYDLFECLPPCRYFGAEGITFFHLSERLTADLVTWCAKKGGKFYSFTQDAGISKEELVKLMEGK